MMAINSSLLHNKTITIRDNHQDRTLNRISNSKITTIFITAKLLITNSNSKTHLLSWDRDLVLNHNFNLLGKTLLTVIKIINKWASSIPFRSHWCLEVDRITIKSLLCQVVRTIAEKTFKQLEERRNLPTIFSECKMDRMLISSTEAWRRLIPELWLA